MNRAMAASATLHCLTGCAIGEIAGLMIGTARGWGDLATTGLAVVLAFLFGYALSTLPLLGAGLALGTALRLVLAADTLSIATMEVVDNSVMAIIPGAMDEGLVNWLFWVAMIVALLAAFVAAYPVNVWLLGRGKGHAITHGAAHGAGHGDHTPPWWTRISTGALAAAVAGFLLGGLVTSIGAELGTGPDAEPVPGRHG